MASLNLRTRGYGGWWGGLGDDACPFVDDTGFCTDVNPSGVADTSPSPLSDPETLAAYQAALAYGAAHPGDVGTPTSTPPPSSTALSTALLAFSQAGIKAVAPNMATGVCPAGYIRNGAACTPQVAPIGSAPLIAGVSNQTLLLIAGGFFFLMLMSQGGGRRR